MTPRKIAHLAVGEVLMSGSGRWLRLVILEVNSSDDPNWMRVGWMDKHGHQHEWRVVDDIRVYDATMRKIESDAIEASR